MRRSYLILLAFLLLLMMSAETGATDPKLRETARGVLSKHGNAVVTAQITTVDPNADTEEVTGTVLSEDGLTVLSLAARRISGGLKIKGAKMILANGREIMAKLVGQDDDHDLAFLMPTEKIKNLPYLKLPEKAQVDLLDEVLLLYQMVEARRTAIVICRVSAEPDKKGNPAALDLGELGLGGPVFDASGRPIGIVTSASPNPLNQEAVIRSGEVIEAALKKIRMK